MSKLALSIIFLLLGYALGIITGVKIDTDTVIKGKIKQKTGRHGRSDIKDVSTDVNINKRKNRRQKNGTKKRKK